jgi:hypothetical protein
MIHADPAQAQTLLQQAWDDLQRAKGAVDPTAYSTVLARVTGGLETISATSRITGTQFYAAPTGATISDLILGPDGAAYAIVGDGVVRIDTASGSVATVVQSGAGSGQGIAKPRLLSVGGPDLLIVDESGKLWRWRPSDQVGGGTLGEIRITGDQVWGPDVVDIATFVINPAEGSYRLYVPYPTGSQILRYEPTADGSGFSQPGPYFLNDSEPVAAFKQILVDGDVYALTAPQLIKYFSGSRTTWSLDPAPDDKNLRPGHAYGLLDATGNKGNGELFIWDSQWQRVLVYNKNDGTYEEQYLAANGAPPLTDVQGMYVVDRGVTQPPLLVWARPDGLYQAPLEQAPQASPSPGASALPSGPAASGLPSARPSLTAPPATTPPTTAVPSESAGPPTERPRRTPRPGTSPQASATP